MLGHVVRAWGLALVVVACSGDDPAPERGPDRFCDGVCQAAVRCGNWTDETACHRDCIESRPGLVNFSADGAGHLGACIANFGCDTLSNESLWDPAFQTCWDDARVVVAPTAKVRSFCSRYAEAWFECGSWYSTDDCEQIYGMWSEAVLDRVLVCQSQPTCADLDACVTNVFDSL